MARTYGPVAATSFRKTRLERDLCTVPMGWVLGWPRPPHSLRPSVRQHLQLLAAFSTVWRGTPPLNTLQARDSRCGEHSCPPARSSELIGRPRQDGHGVDQTEHRGRRKQRHADLHHHEQAGMIADIAAMLKILAMADAETGSMRQARPCATRWATTLCSARSTSTPDIRSWDSQGLLRRAHDSLPGKRSASGLENVQLNIQ